MMRKRDPREMHRVIKSVQIAAYNAASDVSRDHALIGYALMEVAILIAVATRHKSFARLDHRDKVLEAVKTLHDAAWDDAADLFEKIQKDIADG